MADFPPRKYEFGLPAVVQQPFTFDGRDFKHGDAFPYAELGLDEYRMTGMWMAHLVDFVATPPPRATKPDKQRDARR